MAAAGTTVFDFEGMQMKGPASPEAEDFRDFLRRRGIRFFTGLPFRPYHHPLVQKWMG